MSEGAPVKSLAIPILTLMMACLPIGDNAFSVKGRIEAPGIDEETRCSLKLFRADLLARSKSPVKELDIPPEFTVTLTVAPGVHKYYLSITCPGVSESYTSDVFEGGKHEQLITPIDFGTIKLNSGRDGVVNVVE
jgi:hypothetical protein